MLAMAWTIALDRYDIVLLESRARELKVVVSRNA